MVVPKTYGARSKPPTRPRIRRSGRKAASRRRAAPRFRTCSPRFTRGVPCVARERDPCEANTRFTYRDSKPSIVLGGRARGDGRGDGFRVSRSVELRRLLASWRGGDRLCAAVLLARNLFLPSRHVSYPIPVLMMFLLPLASAELGERAARWRRREHRVGRCSRPGGSNGGLFRHPGRTRQRDAGTAG